MGIRETEEYKKMSPYMATGLAEGFEEGTEAEILAAWQYLVDTGMAWKLQGWFGRQAMALLEAGIIEPKEAKNGAEGNARGRIQRA